jgi:hypothetical protein
MRCRVGQEVPFLLIVSALAFYQRLLQFFIAPHWWSSIYALSAVITMHLYFRILFNIYT